MFVKASGLSDRRSEVFNKSDDFSRDKPVKITQVIFRLFRLRAICSLSTTMLSLDGDISWFALVRRYNVVTYLPRS